MKFFRLSFPSVLFFMTIAVMVNMSTLASFSQTSNPSHPAIVVENPYTSTTTTTKIPATTTQVNHPPLLPSSPSKHADTQVGKVGDTGNIPDYSYAYDSLGGQKAEDDSEFKQGTVTKSEKIVSDKIAGAEYTYVESSERFSSSTITFCQYQTETLRVSAFSDDALYVEYYWSVLSKKNPDQDAGSTRSDKASSNIYEMKLGKSLTINSKLPIDQDRPIKYRITYLGKGTLDGVFRFLVEKFYPVIPPPYDKKGNMDKIKK